MSLNPLLNPKTTFSLLKSYISDIDRLEKKTSEEIKKYKDKAFRRVVQNAYNTPVYHEKYKKAGIRPSDIKGLSDIRKLPMVSKDDLKKGFPDKITPCIYNREKAHVVCTPGSGFGKISWRRLSPGKSQ